MDDSYGGTGQFGGNVPTTNGTMTPAHTAGIVVAVSLLALVVIRLGYRDVSISRVTGGLVKA